MKEVAKLTLRVEHLERENKKLKIDAEAHSVRGITVEDREIAFYEASQGGQIRKWSTELIEICRKAAKADDWLRTSDLH